MSIENVLSEFAGSSKGGAIVLQGRWGVGKTYFWRHRIVAELKRKAPETRYSYVSLFGINSLAELKTALAMATAEFDGVEGSAPPESKNKTRTKRAFWWTASKSPEALAFVPTFGSQLARIAERVGFYLIRGRLVCIDDLERRGKSLDLRDVLGLVSFLAEERDCRVVVILNAGHLSSEDSKTWEDYREKVFRGELTYTPTLRQSIDLGLTPDSEEPWSKEIAQHLEELGIGNIRLVRRTADFMHLAVRALGEPPLSQSITKHLAHMLTMLVYSVHGRGDGAPPIKRVLREFTAVDRLAGANGDTRSDEEKAWDDLIQRYGAYPHNPLDKAVLRMVREGYPDEAAMLAARADFEQNARLYEQKEAWDNAWRAYHDTLADNAEEIVAAFERTWPPVSHVEHAHNLQSMAQLLRVLGRSDLATRYVKDWVDYRQREQPDELDPRQLQRFTTVSDPEILKASKRAAEAHHTMLTLEAAWARLAEREFDDNAIAVIAGSSTEDLVALIDPERSEELVKRIQHILQLRGNPGKQTWVEASQKMGEACAMIAARSPLSAYRVKKWFGIEPDAREAETSQA